MGRHVSTSLAGSDACLSVTAVSVPHLAHPEGLSGSAAAVVSNLRKWWREGLKVERLGLSSFSQLFAASCSWPVTDAYLSQALAGWSPEDASEEREGWAR